MMFEKANPVAALRDAPAGAPRTDAKARLRASVAGGAGERFAAHPGRRAGDALRAVEWSEITARLNAARDLRLLLRTESQPPIEAVAASFGDAAASYFALLGSGEPGVNPDALGQSKALDAMVATREAKRPGDAGGADCEAPHGDAREVQ